MDKDLMAKEDLATMGFAADAKVVPAEAPKPAEEGASRGAAGARHAVSCLLGARERMASAPQREPQSALGLTVAGSPAQALLQPRRSSPGWARPSASKASSSAWAAAATGCGAAATADVP